MTVLCEKLPSADFATTISNQTSQSPFDQLPSKFLEEIICALQTKRCLKKFLGLLAAPQLVTLNLNLRYLSKEDDSSIRFEPNSLRCIYLKNLSLRWSSLRNDKFLTTVIPMLVKLQVLDISHTETEDSSLEVIGTYCTDLIELELTECQNISDIGVKKLCVSAAHNLGREDEKLGLHKSLLKLGSYGTKITKAGIQLGLETFRSLKIWDMATVQILAGIHKKDFLNRSPEIQKYSLMNLEIASHCDYIPKSFGLVLSLCPFVIDVEINIVQGLTDSDLLSLLSLEKLRKLKLNGSIDDCSSYVTFTFGGGVTPILKAFGNSLKSLSVSNLCDVNIQVITQLCPNLQFLELIDCFSYFTAKLDEECVKNESLVLKQLEKLSLYAGNSSRPISIPRKHLVLLLSAPSLMDIYIECCCTLNDDVLQEVARVQKFHHLESLEVKKCHNVTEKGIDVFMNAQNPLKKIVLRWCRQVTKSNVDYWKKQAKMNNWQIVIQFDNFEECDVYFHGKRSEDEYDYHEDQNGEAGDYENWEESSESSDGYDFERWL
ncbi:F-box/LRR-repeat protein 4-like isoform X2 [Daphnia pulex]|nr:F-box/LRR-repeat protein 4-like isoform X2 [Daphnia pulex]